MTAAWLHWCGHLNAGDWKPGDACLGCRFEVKHDGGAPAFSGEVERFRLVRIGRHEAVIP